MGYVPPTFEEYMNPELLLARLRRQERRNGRIVGIAVTLIVVIVLLVEVR